MKPHHGQSEKRMEASVQALYEALALIKTSDEAKQFILDLCTPAEIQAMADRLRVVKFIKEGIPYREIYEKTGVSVTTVGRVARCLMSGEGGYHLIYERLEKKQHENNIKTKNRSAKKWSSK